MYRVVAKSIMSTYPNIILKIKFFFLSYCSSLFHFIEFSPTYLNISKNTTIDNIKHKINIRKSLVLYNPLFRRFIAEVIIEINNKIFIISLTTFKFLTIL